MKYSKDFIEAIWQLSEAGRQRKYYRILPEGEVELLRQRKNWQQMTKILNELSGDENV